MKKAIYVLLIIFSCLMLTGFGSRIFGQVPEFTFSLDSTFVTIMNVKGNNINGFEAKVNFDPAFLQYLSYNIYPKNSTEYNSNPFEYSAVNDSIGFVEMMMGCPNQEVLERVDNNLYELGFQPVQPGTTFVKITKAIGYKSLSEECDLIEIENPENKLFISEFPTDQSTIIFKLIFEKR